MRETSDNRLLLEEPSGRLVQVPAVRKSVVKSRRGFFCVGLDQPKYALNIGHVLRAAGCYGAHTVTISGARYRLARIPTDTQRAWRHVPTVCVEDIFEAMPYDCVPVAVDFVDSAEPLHRFTHPERAFYIFGAEDMTLGASVLKRCHRRVYIPTNRCMNLSACVNVVLYDRCAKRGEWPRVSLPPQGGGS